MASSSIRRIRSGTCSGLDTAPCRYSSANPRIEVSGVRSSWLASVTNRRIRSSDAFAACAEASRSPNADSIWLSMPFSATESRPTSVIRP